MILPYGGKLVDLVVTDPERQELLAGAGELRSLQLTPRSVCDLEMLATGAFSPLDRFMGERDYRRVVEEMRLADGTLFPIPITLPVPADLRAGARVALRDTHNELIAVMRVDEVFPWELERESRNVYGTSDAAHPLVAEMNSWRQQYASGPLQVLHLPAYRDFPELRRSPSQVRDLLGQMGRSDVVAFQTRNPIHRAHEEMLRRGMNQVSGSLLIHPAVGLTRPGDVDHYTRVRTYRALIERYFERNRTLLSLLPLAMRLAGPREALWHAIIRRNYGANHFLVGRDHASPGLDSNGRPFYGPYDAQQALARHSEEIGVHMIPCGELLYLPAENRYEEADRVPKGAPALSLSGTQVRALLAEGKPLPPWFTRPEVAGILAHAFPPVHQQGFCLWLTGLPCSGKSTIADILAVLLMERGRPVTVLDGDVVRTHLSKGLGFSREDRDTNILRIGFVASEIARHGGAVICAAVSPYRATRNQVRSMVGAKRFIMLYVSTPLEECERRDTKGLYARARAGELKDFTGIDDPYEAPEAPEITLTTLNTSPEEDARRICGYLEQRGLVLGLNSVFGAAAD